MIRKTVFICFCILCFSISIQSNFAQAQNDASESSATRAEKDATRFNLIDIEGLNVDIDLKTIENGDIGLDYELEYTYPIVESPEGMAGSDVDFKILSKGYIANEKENNQNSLVSEVRIAGHLSQFGFKRDRYGSFLNRRARVIEILDKLETIDAFKEKQKGDALYQELKDLLNPETFRFLTLDLHGKYETDQTFDDHQYAIGAGITTDLAVFTGNKLIADILDFPFSLLRSRKNNHIAQIPRIYFGYDYVTESDIEARKELTADDSFSRLALQLAWMTSIFGNIQIRMTWRGYYEIDAPQEIEDADKELTSFIEVYAGLPIKENESSMIFVKYTNGELPPTIEDSSNFSIGWSVGF